MQRNTVSTLDHHPKSIGPLMRAIFTGMILLLQSCSNRAVNVDGILVYFPENFSAHQIKYAVSAIRRVDAVLPTRMKDRDLSSIRFAISAAILRGRTTTKSNTSGTTNALVRLNSTDWKIHLEHELVHAFGGLRFQPDNPFVKEGLAEYFGSVASPFRSEKELESLYITSGLVKPMLLSIHTKWSDISVRMDTPGASRDFKQWGSLGHKELSSKSMSRTDYAAAHVVALHCATDNGELTAECMIDTTSRLELRAISRSSFPKITVEKPTFSAYLLRAYTDTLSLVDESVRRELSAGRLPSEIQLSIIGPNGASLSLTNDTRFIEIVQLMSD